MGPERPRRVDGMREAVQNVSPNMSKPPKQPEDRSETHSELLLPESERLVNTRADLSDYPRTPAMMYGRVRELLEFIEDALAADDAAKLKRLAALPDLLQGLNSKGARIRRALALVDRAIERVREGAKGPERAALWLIINLEVLDARYSALRVEDALGVLKDAASFSTSTGNPGRGARGGPATLAALMTDVGAEGVASIDEARSLIKNAQRKRDSLAQSWADAFMRGLYDK